MFLNAGIATGKYYILCTVLLRSLLISDMTILRLQRIAVLVRNIASKNACCKTCLLKGAVLIYGVEPNLLCGRIGARILFSLSLSLHRAYSVRYSLVGSVLDYTVQY